MISEVTEADYMALVEAIGRVSTDSLSSLAAGVLAAGYLGIADDSLSFARIFDLEHALVLRTLTELGQLALIDIKDRDARTQRTVFALSDKGAQLMALTV